MARIKTKATVPAALSLDGKGEAVDVLKVYSPLQPPCLFELAEQPIVCPQGEVQCPGFVKLGVRLEVLDDVCDQVGSLHAAARRLVAQLGEVDVQVVIRGLVVQVDSQLTGWKVVALENSLLIYINKLRMNEATLSKENRDAQTPKGHLKLTFPFWKMFCRRRRCSAVRSRRLLMSL